MLDTASQTTQRQSPLQGALVWVAFSVVAVAVRGVRWDETYEHALVITRLVPYPEGHPFFVYCRNVFSGQSYLSALFLWRIDAPLLLNGLRNVLQLCFATVPVYLIGARLGGRPWHGHVAVLFILLGVHQGFQSYYPIEIWPHFYSVGQIGAGYALLVLALVLHGCYRSAAFLLGLMPAVHLGQVPVIAAVAGLQWLWWFYQGERGLGLRAVVWTGVGFVPCMLFYLVHRQCSVPLPDAGAYAAQGDAHAIWAAYSALHDIHRNMPRLNPFWKSSMVAMMALFLAVGAAKSRWRAGSSDFSYGWVALYAAITMATVYTIWWLQRYWGPETPFLLIGWMPYRLFNHLAVLAVPVAVGMLLGAPPGRARLAGSAFVALALFYGSLLPLWEALLPFAFYQRYAGNPELLFFGLVGAAVATPFLEPSRLKPRRSWISLAVLATIFLATYYPFGAAAFFAGGAVWIAGRTLCGRIGARADHYLRVGLQVAGAMLLSVLLCQQWLHREQLPVHPIQTEVARYLAERDEGGAMLVTPYWDVEWLGKTRHPIFADYQTAHLMTYVPALAPGLKKMHEEVFGFTIDGESGPPLGPWPTRTAEAWRALGERYGFRYVLAPAELALTLEPELEGLPYNLYRVAP